MQPIQLLTKTSSVQPLMTCFGTSPTIQVDMPNRNQPNSIEREQKVSAINIPQRGFSPKEFETRVERARQIMHRHKFDALLVSSPPNVRYFTGFDSQFWESPTRPWFVVVPLGRGSGSRHPRNRSAGNGADLDEGHSHLAGSKSRG
ncbi:aminopeptidase P family N-terminal domain-containing protein [Rhizobium beringeri]